ncbi:hypothetical protein LEN26_003300, partial [Aphanomyces euteiches]
HAIDNSESGKQAERNAVQESASTGAYGMAVDDDALNKGNINDEGAMRKAKKAEYNKRAREKKRQALNEELAMEKTKKAAYNKRAREKKREALLEEVDKSKKAEYNKRAREKKREAPLKEVDKSKKAEYNKRAYGKKRHAIMDTVDEEVAMKRSKKAEDNKRAREKKRNTEVANQEQDAIVLHHTDMDQSNEEESKEGEDGFHYHAQSGRGRQIQKGGVQQSYSRKETASSPG